jgi:hypothetical protein
MNNPIILEKGYNTSGLYAFVTSLFYNRSDSINKILNTDTNDSSVGYIQEFIKADLISRLQSDKSIPVYYINRFRNLLLNYGWRKDKKHKLDYVLQEADPTHLYKFLFGDIMDTKMIFERVDSRSNTINDISFDTIEITDQDLFYAQTNNAEKRVVDLSQTIRSWMMKNVVEYQNHNYSYRFKEIPYIVPVIINLTEQGKNLPIDIKQAIGFQSLSDPVQKIFTWDIQSIVLYDEEEGVYKSLIKDDDNKWYIVDQSSFPANRLIDMKDPKIANNIARQIRTVYYKIK